MASSFACFKRAYPGSRWLARRTPPTDLSSLQAACELWHRLVDCCVMLQFASFALNPQTGASQRNLFGLARSGLRARGPDRRSQRASERQDKRFEIISQSLSFTMSVWSMGLARDSIAARLGRGETVRTGGQIVDLRAKSIQILALGCWIVAQLAHTHTRSLARSDWIRSRSNRPRLKKRLHHASRACLIDSHLFSLAAAAGRPRPIGALSSRELESRN